MNIKICSTVIVFLASFNLAASEIKSKLLQRNNNGINRGNSNSSMQIYYRLSCCNTAQLIILPAGWYNYFLCFQRLCRILPPRLAPQPLYLAVWKVPRKMTKSDLSCGSRKWRRSQYTRWMQEVITKTAILQQVYRLCVVLDDPLENARHWSDDKKLEGRGFFRSNVSPGRLIIDNVKHLDGGMYKCRVDFQHQPTTISHVNLTVNSEWIKTD